MSEIIPKKPLNFGLFSTLPHKKWAVLALTSVLLGIAFDTALVVVLKNLTDSIAVGQIVIENVWKWAVAFPLVYLIANIFWRLSGFTGMHWFMNFRTTAYQSLYNHLTLHSKDFFNSKFAGSLTNKIGNAVDGTQEVFEIILWEFIPVIAGIIWYTIFVSLNDIRLGLIIIAWSIIYLLVNIYFAKKLHPYSFLSAKSLSNLKGRIVDSISNISLVHEYGHVAGERNYIGNYIGKAQKAGITSWRLGEWTLVANTVMIFIFISAMLFTSISLFQSGVVSIGVVVMVVAIVSQLSSDLYFIGKEMRYATKHYGQAKEGLKEILIKHLIVDKPNARPLTVKKGKVDIDSISFEYENSHVFNNFSLSIPAGQKIGLVGRSGAGKTTLVSILLRHFEVQKGQIRIDDQNIYDVKLNSLRNSIAFVPQDTSLFHRSIMENIRYSKPNATEQEVIQASKQAQADEFINSLSLGYDTLVGERGVKLSGGQRQRIAIARAFLKDAPILILDEATSSLDSQSEQAIQESLEKLMKKRTVIAIAHRLSTLKKMDRIVILENGKIIEDGPPSELMNKKDGTFKKMWDHQVKGFIIDK